jgi:hypothetical protein
MRPDMAKVIVERPRIGSRRRGTPKGSRRAAQRLGPDNLPRRQGIKRPHQGGTKSFNEHLAPLVRYLQKQVGRPWDKVFSDICAHVDRASAVQDHVRDHLDDFVTVHVVFIDGRPCHGGGGRWPGFGQPLTSGRRWPRFYVCPRTGLLRQVPVAENKHQARAGRSQADPGPVRIGLGKLRQLHLVNARWHLVELRSLPRDIYGRYSGRDALLGRIIDGEEALRRYGARVCAVHARSLSADEVAVMPIPVDLLRPHDKLPNVVRG